ncbi:MAG: hypothetical protein HFI72_04210 [Peptococcaceae bacterium]|nr:hypothetical protein [Peptococcaceae bacterium]
MNRFQRKNLMHIKERFQQETGVNLNTKKSYGHYRKPLLLFAAILLCSISLTAFGFQLFSGLTGDELVLGATYQGNGIITIAVENQSDKDLYFQPKLKLMKWNSGEEIQPRSNSITFTGRAIPSQGKGTMTIDLSSAYDIALLEQPLLNDSYYLVLTNNNFIFGQDWMCNINFTENSYTPQPSVIPQQAEAPILKQIPEQLHFYFEADSTNAEERRQLNTAYKEAYTKLFADFDGKIISSVSPILPGNRIDSTKPYPHIKDLSKEESQLITMQWHSTDSRFKLLATEGEHALVISAALPLEKYEDASTMLPLFFLLTYEKEQIAHEHVYAFIYGQTIPFSQLTPYEVYSDETYVCYEISPFIYTDFNNYLQDFAGSHPEISLDETTTQQAKDTYQYYRENLPDLIYFP